MTKVTHLTLDERGGLNRQRIHLREISGDADAPLETVGQDLRAARLRRGDDLAAVSRVLKIRKDHLEALEEDHLEGLPGRTYAVGFVRSYADYLGLDPVQCVERFKREIAGRSETPQTAAFPAETAERQLPHGWVVIAIALLCLVVYGAYHLAMSADTLMHQPVAPVPARMAPPPASGETSSRTPVPAKPVAQAANGQTPAAPLAGVASQPAPSSATPAGNQASATAAPSPQVPSAATQTAALPQGQIFGDQSHQPRVILRARATIRVLVQGPDGSVFLDRVLRPGDSYYVPNRVGMTLTTQNSGAIDVELDGQPMGAAGPLNRISEALSLDPQAIVDRSNGGGGG
jgi:cytoskeleton protein RodZ